MLDPCTFVIFGATGNLAAHKLLPALYQLERSGSLPDEMAVVGVGRRDWDDELWRGEVEALLRVNAREGSFDEKAFASFAKRLHFVEGNMRERACYDALSVRIADDDRLPSANLVFYLAIPPALFETVVCGLGDTGLAQDREHVRIVVEKPLGHDLDSFREI
ncbi:MAG: glucose-6-phosphate dehydrogenase, partial [Acidihalobacter sp.]